MRKYQKLGPVFGERITRGGVFRKHQSSKYSPRWVILAGVLVVSILIGIARLVDLQIIRGSYFKALAEGNRVRHIPIKAPRGEILDTAGHALARNIPVYKLATFSEGGVVVETEGISREEALLIQASDPERSGRILVDIGREYPLGVAAAHVVGYVNEAAPEEVGESPNCDLRSRTPYALGDLVGRIGIEAQYECILRGVNGEELIEVDSQGRLIRRLGRREPISGTSITLSIYSSLQEASYQALIDAPNEEGTRPAREDGITVRGAVVAQDPRTGEVLSLVSVPSFDPARLGEKYEEYKRDENLPFFNRAIGGAYAPGSTFKIAVAAASLEEEKINEDYEYEDKGIITVNDFSYRNWYFTQYGRTEGFIKIVRAITRSTDTFFYKVGELVGVDSLGDWAGKFGLGKLAGIDLPGEKAGLVPTPEWKQEVKGDRWYLGNTYHLSIGQGDILTTPLQVNMMAGVIAAGGKLCVPNVLKDDASQDDKCEEVGVKDETIKLITEGMVGACSLGGTAYPLFTFEPKVACKTGTAEFGGSDKTHAWLTAFAPAFAEASAGKPEIAVTALVEGGGEGSRVAAPVVKKVLEEWFSK